MAELYILKNIACKFFITILNKEENKGNFRNKKKNKSKN